MSQFLWIEDFENNPKAATESVFGSILHDIVHKTIDNY